MLQILQARIDLRVGASARCGEGASLLSVNSIPLSKSISCVLALGDTDGNAAGSMEHLINSGRWNGIATEYRPIFTHIAKFPLFQRIGETSGPEEIFDSNGYFLWPRCWSEACLSTLPQLPGLNVECLELPSPSGVVSLSFGYENIAVGQHVVP
ncbi:hypothetical protein KHF85_05695 [Xanthomonas translucens pv. graminis]|uniref:hypothetical protein n=1 Tax=Xanthomonas graminis TaxID=3390026 RepID=UPI002541A693|nr:hypothetical protein [Xanthomonas translucens]WIH05951.1 hypothetical protein KHF85_05695 [Xanthomonas translucens pv. graminis]